MDLTKKYAKCLFEEVKGKETMVLKKMSSLLSVFKQRDIILFLNSPQLSEDEKEKILDEVFKERGIQPELFNLIKLLVVQLKIGLFESIFKAFQNLVDEKAGVVRGTIKTSSSVDSNQRNSIEKAIEKRIQKKVIFEYEESNHLLGGVVAEVGHLTFDNTLKTQLNRLKEGLSRGVE